MTPLSKSFERTRETNLARPYGIESLRVTRGEEVGQRGSGRMKERKIVVKVRARYRIQLARSVTPVV